MMWQLLGSKLVLPLAGMAIWLTEFITMIILFIVIWCISAEAASSVDTDTIVLD